MSRTTTDSSINALHGTMATVNLSKPGKDGGCYTSVSTVGPLFYAGNSPLFTPNWNSPWSFSCWVYSVNGDSDQMTLFDNTNGTSYTTLADAGIRFTWAGGNFYCMFSAGTSYAYPYGTAHLTASTWQHLVVTWSGATGYYTDFTLYINGVAKTLSDYGGGHITSNPVTSRVPTIGCYAANEAQTVISPGVRLDMLSFWNGTALSAGAVLNIYNNPTGAYILSNYSTSLVALYNLDETDVAQGITNPIGGDYAPTFKGQFVDVDVASVGQKSIIMGILDVTQAAGLIAENMKVGPANTPDRFDGVGLAKGVN